MNINKIKESARGHEPDILINVAGIPAELLDGKHHPCPLCGGKDRFRLLNNETGAVFCNQCFNKENGDFIAAVRHFRNVDFKESLRLIGEYLGIDSETVKTGKPKQKKRESETLDTESETKSAIPAITTKQGNLTQPLQDKDVAGFLQYKKGITTDSLRKSGAATGTHQNIPVVVFPIYNIKEGKIELTGKVAYRRDGKEFEINRRKVKIKTLPGTKSGIVGKDAVTNIVNRKQVKIIFLTAGISDYLSLQSVIYKSGLESEYFSFTNSCGENENIENFKDLLQPALTGQNVAVIMDNDDAGRKAATKRAQALTTMRATTVRIIELPTEKNGQPVKDTRDFFNAEGTFDELLQLFESATIADNKPKNEKPKQNIPQALPEVKNETLRNFLNKITPVYWEQPKDENGNPKGEISEKKYKMDSLDQIIETAKKNKTPICSRNDEPYFFCGTYWTKIETRDFKSFLILAAIRCDVPVNTARDDNFTDKIEKQFHNITSKHTDCNAVFINLKNGTLFFDEKGEHFKPHNSDDFIRYVLPFEYNTAADCPKWQQHLDRVLPSKEVQEYLAECFALPFIKHLKIEKVPILYGSGANGKSVCLEVYSALIGRENATAETLEKLTKTDYTGDYARAGLDGKLINIATDISPKIADSGLFKSLVSGEPVSCRQPYGRPFVMVNYARLIFAMNELPFDCEKTNAFFRRLAIINFSETIPYDEQILDLAAQIQETELSGVLNWIIAGLKRILKRGKLPIVPEIENALENFRTDSDPVLQWVIEQRMIPGILESNTLKEAYSELTEFLKDNGNRSMGKTKFSKRLKKLGFDVEKFDGKNTSIRYSTGDYMEYKKNKSNPDNQNKKLSGDFRETFGELSETQISNNKEVTQNSRKSETFSGKTFSEQDKNNSTEPPSVQLPRKPAKPQTEQPTNKLFE